jgi:hypothetical protein
MKISTPSTLNWMPMRINVGQDSNYRKDFSEFCNPQAKTIFAQV